MASVHRILLEKPDFAPGQEIRIEADEAHHAARSKRLRPGDPVELLNGNGLRAQATIEEIARDRTGPVLHLRILSAETVPPVSPRLTVMAATPKRGRADELVDSLAQVGAAAWRPLITARTVVDPRPAKLDRLARVAIEAAKQSGRAWMLQVGPPITLAQALAETHDAPGKTLVLADASGGPYEPSGDPEIHLLIGPEGGFEPAELALARDAAAQIASFGPHVMRIETAAVAAAAIVLAAEHAHLPEGATMTTRHG